MSKPDFVYQIYIRATREKVWRAFLEPEFTRQYWIHDNVSDWKPGSKWEHKRSDGVDAVDIEGKVLHSEPHERLILSWSRHGDMDNPARTSKVTLILADIDWPGGPWTSLTLEHTDFQDDKEMQDSVSGGWPMVFSGMKTLLEVGSLTQMKLPEDE